MKLLIVESPGKIKKLQGILGGQWNVAASVGHFRDLPNSGLGVEDTNSYKPIYEITKKDVVKKLKDLASKADEVYLATDPDREGEAIAWHLEDVLKLKNPKRVTYTSITEKDVKEGIANARTTDMNMVYAQEARRVLDRFCGYIVSPALRGVYGESFSAGRVQSPATRIIVERERAIRSFISTTHYGVELLFNQVDNIQNGFKAVWKTDTFRQDNEDYILDKNLAEEVAKIRNVEVIDFKEEEKSSAPPSPFTTSSLQQGASNALKFDPKKTMQVAQALYEQGHITYMRTDSPNLSDEAVQEIRAFADANNYPLVDVPRKWKSKDGSQEAHEAIRATHIELETAGTNADEKALYNLIRLRCLASQIEDAKYSVRTLEMKGTLDGKDVFFTSSGRTEISKGFKAVQEDTAVADEEAEDISNEIPKYEIGQTIVASEANLQTKKTSAPGRFTLAALIRELEKKGIGRPATYASILDNILKKGYIKEEKRKLQTTPLGEKLFDCMNGYFQFLEFDFTKNMEERLDDIAQGKASYKDIVADNYNILTKEVQKMKEEKAIPCPACSGLNLKHLKGNGANGAYDYFKCEDCKKNFNNENGRPVEKAGHPLTDFECTKCSSKLKHLKGNGVKGAYDFFACSNDDCKESYKNIDGKPVAKGEEPLTDFDCKKCNDSKLKEVKGVKKDGTPYHFFACPKCEHRYWPTDNKKSPKYD